MFGWEAGDSLGKNIMTGFYVASLLPAETDGCVLLLHLAHGEDVQMFEEAILSILSTQIRLNSSFVATE